MALEVAVVGGHGKIALRLLRLLSDRGDRARGLIRNPDHAGDVEATGATAVGADVENLDADGVARSIAGVDAVVFAAGAGAGSGPARKHTVDYGGAVKLIETGLEYTIVRPGGLTDDPGTGTIDAAEDLGRYDRIPREDVAATLVGCLDEPATIRKSFDLLAGETPI